MEILNSCDKEVFQISEIDQVKRFLALGSDNGTYYITPQDLTKLNIESIENVLKSNDKSKLIDLIKLYIGKCKKHEPLVYLLARCCVYDSQNSSVESLEFRKSAYELLDKVCTIPTNLFLFLKYTKLLYNKHKKSNGWNNLHKRAVCNWYNSKDDMNLIYQMTKYKDRHDYTHRDVMRLSHIIANSVDKQHIYRYFVKGFDAVCGIMGDESDLMGFIRDYEIIKSSEDEDLVIQLINKRNFAREHISTHMLSSKLVWDALITRMPPIALLRNLNKLTICGLLDNFEGEQKVVEKIKSIKNVHPMHLLIALKMYSSGEGFKGSNKWIPNQSVVDSLNDKFYNLFQEVIPSNKRVCIAMDVSGSMHYSKANGTECMSAAEISCALTMVMKHCDPKTEIMGFSSTFIPLAISPGKRLDDNLEKIKEIPFSSTDISLPFIWARENQKEFDAFIVITDNETNCNKIKPVDALRQYRSLMRIPNCKLIVVAMTANNVSIADPNDRNMLDIAGFDASVPDIINEFIRDE
jgi:60 kDa SS-A/Ro ribonucleoprotein